MSNFVTCRPHVFKDGHVWVATWSESSYPHTIVSVWETWQEAFDDAYRAGKLFVESVAKFRTRP